MVAQKEKPEGYAERIAWYLEGVKFFSTGVSEKCPSCNPEQETWDDDARELAGEGSFSWSSCESCTSHLGGDRYPAHGFIDDELHHFSVCVDCVHFHAYGTIPEHEQHQEESDD